ncbi:hypothetical protein DHEL01_v202864 [Diaporthe helianthi]|uniref:Infection structure specific protein n=1 Tax=Diaporthe helianthi TaxID=158607 RepID=A0A2P5I8C0_DIAHE|nr:hypothetical protein DHEL01_v202864 [Diaporthe helianthi]
MYSQLVITALVATASASNNLFPGHNLLVARQTTDAGAAPTGTSGGLSDSECQESLLSIATELPNPSDDLLEWEMSQAGTDPCSVTSIPASLSSQYSSYTDAVWSWYSESSSELIAAISACPQYAGAVSDVQVCTEVTMTGASANPTVSVVTQTDGSEPSTTTGSAATGSSTSTPSGSASQSAETTAGAPLLEAGIVGAVLAGLLGVAIIL